MKRNAFGQIVAATATTRPFLRYFAPAEGEGSGGGDGGGNGSGSEFIPPASQDEFNRIIADRVARAERSAREDERRKIADAAKPTGDGKPKDDDKPQGVSENDVDKRIADALAAKDLELAVERVSDQLDKALEGRTFPASKLFSLDRKQFVKEDGKTVDIAALKKWAEENSAEVEAADPKRRPIPGQGQRGEATTGLESGKSAYEKRHPKKN